MTMTSNTQRRVLTMFSIIMITVTSVDSIRNLPATALFGSKLIFFFILAALVFLLPAALVSAELAASWNERGGVYLWVKKAFGPHWGFLAIWFQWVENIIWYPTILSFLAGTLAYIISPTLAANKYYLTAVIWIVFWAISIIVA
jgi:amino acid transporter